jgi:putative transposase
VLSIRRQCELLTLTPSSYYYQTTRTPDTLNQLLLNLVDEEYTRHPFLGTRKMLCYLQSLGYAINRKRVQNIYRTLGIEAIYCKPNTSQPHPEHKVYPYLLRGLSITRPNQVYCSDITYIRTKKGFMYCCAIMDWFSRYVLGWALSPTLEADFCVELLQDVLCKNHCAIFNTDQGSQFTAAEFVAVLHNKQIKISMDGRGRYLDNIFIERLWRSLKYECIYLNEFTSVLQLEKVVQEYFDYYNHLRPHQAYDKYFELAFC